ncbi:unnamed protein product [Victoria cruziana]
MDAPARRASVPPTFTGAVFLRRSLPRRIQRGEDRTLHRGNPKKHTVGKNGRTCKEGISPPHLCRRRVPPSFAASPDSRRLSHVFAGKIRSIIVAPPSTPPPLYEEENGERPMRPLRRLRRYN